MIPVRSDVQVWLASGHTDMRKGMGGLALLVQEGFGRDPFAGDVFVFRGRSGSLLKALWHAELASHTGGIGWYFSWCGGIFRFTPGAGYDSIMGMQASVSPMPDDVEALNAALAAARIEAAEARADAAAARARQSDGEALIAHLKLQIEKLKRQLYGTRSERGSRLLDQLELQLEELEATASQDEAAAQMAARKVADAPGFERRRPSRQPFPEHLPRERVVIAAPCACPACGGTRLSKIGEDVTETLEVIPRQWKVIQTVREKVLCRDCETISQPPAPFHVVARGWAGPSFLAMMLFEKYGQHQPLNRQVERYGREGVPLSLSTLADQVGAAAAVLEPLHHRLRAHVLGPSGCMGMIPACRSWPRARQQRAGSGLMCAMIARLVGRPHRRHCSTIPLTGPVNIQGGTWPTGPASCRPMLMAVTPGSMMPAADPRRSWRRAVGAMRAAPSSCSPI
jgi:transposase